VEGQHLIDLISSYGGPSLSDYHVLPMLGVHSHTT
jgi:hypothetical protein